MRERQKKEGGRQKERKGEAVSLVGKCVYVGLTFLKPSRIMCVCLCVFVCMHVSVCTPEPRLEKPSLQPDLD